jgi:hypothetical protein
VGKAGNRNTPENISRASIEPALQEARTLLGMVYRLDALEADPHRARARRMVMQTKFSRYLRDYLLRVLDEKPATPRAKRGRPSNTNRDYWIVRVLARLVVLHNLPLTRRRGGLGRRLSACAIVAQVLGELGIKLEEAGVEAIWSKRRSIRQARSEMMEARLKDLESAR